MKKSLVLLFCGIAVAAIAATSSISWEKTKLSIGEVKVNESVDISFQFTNSSSNEVVILEAKGSCGCTQVNYPKEPIAPGTSAKVTGKFRASKAGAFHKTIKVKTSDSEEYAILSFNGTAVK